MMKVRLLRVEPEAHGTRVDVWLAQHVAELSRKTAQRLCDQQRVLQNGRRVKKSDPVQSGANISYDLDESDEALPAPEIPLVVVKETPHFVVVNKPAGIPCAAVYGRNTGTLAGALLARYPEMSDVGFGPRDPGLVHRLDTFTSGLVVAARNETCFLELRSSLQAQRWDKRYLALVTTGALPDHGQCLLPLAPDPKNQRRVRIDERHGKPCTSTFAVLSRGARFDLVEVRAPNAYRHQVRAHLAALGAPLIGDLIYGGLSFGLSPRHALHANYVSAPMAGLGELTCVLPDDLRVLLDSTN